MGESLDVEHQRRLRAERVLTLLRELWGDEPPPGLNSQLSLLIDAVATDDEHAREQRLVSHGDGLSYTLLAALWRQGVTPSRQRSKTIGAVPAAGEESPPPAPLAFLPPALLARLQDLALLDSTTTMSTSSTVPRPLSPAGIAMPTEATREEPTYADTSSIGVWELDPVHGTVAYDAVGAQLIGAGHDAGSARVEEHLQQLIHPEDREHIAQTLQHCLDTGDSYRMRFRTVSATGAITWLVSNGRVIRNAGDATARLAGFIALDQDRTAEEATQPATSSG